MVKVSFDCTQEEYDKLLESAQTAERTIAQQLRYMIKKCDAD